MAGHSKFKNIMHRKGAQDKKRSSMFSKLSREITVAAKMGMPDPDMNPRLRLAVNAAKAQSMPKDNIQRAIDKAAAAGGEDYVEIRYEGYGPGGVALIVDALTDNRNRTATNVRTAFSKNGGNLGSEGSVSHGFERRGLIEYGPSVGDEEAILEAAIEAGADDVESSEDGHTIWTAADALHGVAGELEKALGAADNVKLAWKPVLTVDVDEATAGTLMKLIDALDDDDDVQTVWGNYEISDAVMEKLGLIILGLDPSLSCTGWGVIRSEGARISHVANGQIKTDAAAPMATRLAALQAGLAAVIAEHAPTRAAAEEIFVNKNPQSTLKLAQARGAVLAACGAAGLSVNEHAARLVKKAVTGTGAAEKAQVAAMVKVLLPGVQIAGADAADALAVAIADAHLGGAR